MTQEADQAARRHASKFFQRVDIVIAVALDLWKLATPGSEHLSQRALICRFITSGANIGIFIRQLTVETAGHDGAVMLVASNTALAGSCRVEETAKGSVLMSFMHALLKPRTGVMVVDKKSFVVSVSTDE